MNSNLSSFRKGLVGASVAAALALTSGAASAVVFNNFDVDPTYDNNATDSFTADKMTGNYAESIVFNNDGTFDVRLRWVAGQFVADDGTNPLAAGDTLLGVDYSIYAFYEGSGTFSTSGGVTTFTTAIGDGFFSLYFDDRAPNTVFSNTGSAINYSNIFAVSAGTNTDDTLLASGTPGAGSGTLDPTSCSTGGINCGSFGTSVSLALTDFGKTFFIDPIPFYNISFQSGQLNNFDVSGEQLINGSLDVVFSQVPEPGVLALLGLAFTGLGLVGRQRKA